MSPSRPRSSLQVLVASVATWLLVCVAVASAHGGGFPGGHHADDARHAWLHAQLPVDVPPDVPGERLREDDPRPHGKRLLAVAKSVAKLGLDAMPTWREHRQIPAPRVASHVQGPDTFAVPRGWHDPHSRRALGRAPPFTTRSAPTPHA